MQAETPCAVKSQADFAASFKKANYVFKYFEMELESGGDAVDVEFNYKDLAHLTTVHNTFNIFYSYIGDDIMSCVIMQKLFGINFPMTHVALQLGKNHLFFHDSFLNVILTSEVLTHPLPNHRVRVNTTYGIGASRLILPFVFPILKRLLTRNFHVLMKGDKPMRDRRGELRQWGLELPKQGYSFVETRDLRPRHVFPPAKESPPDVVRVPLSSVTAGVPLMIGRSDHYGLQLFRRGEIIEIFPRLCPHEGACLDRERLTEEKGISCPWHGRRFGPLFSISPGHTEGKFVSHFHRFALSGDTLTIEPLPVGEQHKTADWTSAAIACPGAAGA